jgi:hypothetical protein
LHKLERATTDQERQAAAQGFLAWLKPLDMLGPAPEKMKQPS